MTTIQEKCWVQGVQSNDVFGAVYEAQVKQQSTDL